MLRFTGVVVRVARWACVPVPFRIPVTCGQQRGLPWIAPARIENPSTWFGAAVRMASEVFLFRSLFRNTNTRVAGEPGRLVTLDRKMLWLSALAFHYALLVVALRHLRFVIEPAPGFVSALAVVDGFFQAGTPPVYLTDFALLGALGWLFGRRLADPLARFCSLLADYFALLLVGGVAASGILMRHVWRVDVAAAKTWAMSLLTFRPDAAAAPDGLFLVHVCLASALVAWLPFGKLAHAAGILLSPTRVFPNDTRRRRHVNPWNPPVAVHTYAEWEREFQDRLVSAGLPLDRDGEHG